MTSDLVELESGEGYAATLARVENAITSHGMAIFARVDHAAGAKDAGLTMPPTIVNPKGGTPMMLAAPQSALDLPLRVAVREEKGRAIVSYHPVGDMLVRAGVPKDLAAKLEPAQQVIANALVK